MRATKFHTHTKQQAKLEFCVSYCLNFWIANWKPLCLHLWKIFLYFSIMRNNGKELLYPQRFWLALANFQSVFQNICPTCGVPVNRWNLRRWGHFLWTFFFQINKLVKTLCIVNWHSIIYRELQRRLYFVPFRWFTTRKQRETIFHRFFVLLSTCPNILNTWPRNNLIQKGAAPHPSRLSELMSACTSLGSKSKNFWERGSLSTLFTTEFS